jgi:hypothetical protein
MAVCVSDEAHPYRFAMLEGEAALSDGTDDFMQVGMSIGR